MKVECSNCKALVEIPALTMLPQGAGFYCTQCGHANVMAVQGAAGSPAPPPAPAAAISRPFSREDILKPNATIHEIWRVCLANWSDEKLHARLIETAVHRREVEMAGRYYKDYIAEHPGDAFAVRMRDRLIARVTADMHKTLVAERPRSSAMLKWIGWTLSVIIFVVMLAVVVKLVRARSSINSSLVEKAG
ncbi:MAG: hypothetical protein GMKNLPBB_01049 [Myxococcota bacterium]|nr:hypothetical protein [Myxococcota bacterium]